MPTGNKEKKKPWKHYRVGGGGGGGGGSQAEGGANYSHHSRQAPPTSNNKHVRHGAPFQSHHHKPIHTNSLKRTRDTEHTDYRAHQPRQQQQHNIATAPSASSSIPSPATLVPTNPSPPAREIPGFYYDTEKKKYFKITAVHLVKSQHPFSRDAIAEKTRQKVRPNTSQSMDGSRRSALYPNASFDIIFDSPCCTPLYDPRNDMIQEQKDETYLHMAILTGS